MTKNNYQTALEFVRTSAGTDKGCVAILDVIIAGLETVYGECAEAHYEPECSQCENSVRLRKLRVERDEWRADASNGHITREYLARMRAKHEQKLINSSASYMAEQECLDAIEAAATHYGSQEVK